MRLPDTLAPLGERPFRLLFASLIYLPLLLAVMAFDKVAS